MGVTVTTESDTTSSDGSSTMTAVKDRIYAGDPATLPDGYYNHAAALEAASKFAWRPEYDDVIWHNNDDDYDDKDFCSTSHRNKGGQLKGREAQFEEGDVVEVLYDEDEEEDPVWYEATVLKKIEYQDDIRYNVHYHVDNAVQNNVREEKIRATAKTQSKKKKKKKAAAKKSKSSLEDLDSPEPTQKRKPGRPKGSTNKKSPAKSKSPKKKGRPKKKVEYTSEQLRAAKEMGLPRGWAVVKEGDFSSIMKDPDGKKYKTQKAAFAAAGLVTQTTGRKRKAVELEEEEVDEGDPPWRTTGHEYLSREVTWNGVNGLVTGWISETDVDSNGEPGFVSSESGKPAKLFHAIFDEFEQDFEEFELEECLV